MQEPVKVLRFPSETKTCAGPGWGFSAAALTLHLVLPAGGAGEGRAPGPTGPGPPGGPTQQPQQQRAVAVQRLQRDLQRLLHLVRWTSLGDKGGPVSSEPELLTLALTLALLSVLVAASEPGPGAESGLVGRLRRPGAADPDQVQGEPHPGGSEEAPEEDPPELLCVLQDLQDLQVRRQRLHEVQRRNLLTWDEEQQQRGGQSCPGGENLRWGPKEVLVRL